jgi:hypothetical protein
MDALTLADAVALLDAKSGKLGGKAAGTGRGVKAPKAATTRSSPKVATATSPKVAIGTPPKVAATTSSKATTTKTRKPTRRKKAAGKPTAANPPAKAATGKRGA